MQIYMNIYDPILMPQTQPQPHRGTCLTGGVPPPLLCPSNWKGGQRQGDLVKVKNDSETYRVRGVKRARELDGISNKSKITAFFPPLRHCEILAEIETDERLLPELEIETGAETEIETKAGCGDSTSTSTSKCPPQIVVTPPSPEVCKASPSPEACKAPPIPLAPYDVEQNLDHKGGLDNGGGLEIKAGIERVKGNTTGVKMKAKCVGNEIEFEYQNLNVTRNSGAINKYCDNKTGGYGSCHMDKKRAEIEPVNKKRAEIKIEPDDTQKVNFGQGANVITPE